MRHTSNGTLTSSATARAWPYSETRFLWKNPTVARARGRREPDDVGVEVLQHLPPHVVDRPVALVDDDEVERLRGMSAL